MYCPLTANLVHYEYCEHDVTNELHLAGWPNFGCPVEQGPLHGYVQSPGLGSINTMSSNQLPGLASILPPHISSPGKIAPIGKDTGRVSHKNHFVTEYQVSTDCD